MYLLGEAARKARVDLQKFVHLVVVSGKDYNQFVHELLFRHYIDDLVHRFLREVSLAQAVRLIDE